MIYFQLVLPNCVNEKPCQNNGICYKNDSKSNKLECACLPGFSGLNCELKLSRSRLLLSQMTSKLKFREPPYTKNKCSINLCQNNSTCLYDEKTNSITCICKPGFVGHLCQKQLSESNACKFKKCNYRGQCLPAPASFNNYICLCDSKILFSYKYQIIHFEIMFLIVFN